MIVHGGPEPKVVIYGNGAMARVLCSYAQRTMNIAGFTVDDACINGNDGRFLGLPLVPFSRLRDIFDPACHQLIIAVGFLEMNELRNRKYLEVKEMGYTFASYVHDSVMIHDDLIIEENCIILDHVSIHPGSRIGHGTFISSNVNIGHDCDIGPLNWINSGVSIAGGCHAGSGCFFGVNSSTGHGLRIGSHNFIAANTFINKNTNDDEVYLSEAGQRFPMSSHSFLTFARITA